MSYSTLLRQIAFSSAIAFSGATVAQPKIVNPNIAEAESQIINSLQTHPDQNRKVVAEIIRGYGSEYNKAADLLSKSKNFAIEVSSRCFYGDKKLNDQMTSKEFADCVMHSEKIHYDKTADLLGLGGIMLAAFGLAGGLYIMNKKYGGPSSSGSNESTTAAGVVSSLNL